MVCKNQAKNTFLVLLMDGVREKGILVVKSFVSSQNVVREKCRCGVWFKTAMLLITWSFSNNKLGFKKTTLKMSIFRFNVYFL